MTSAAIYARVSSARQKKDQTIGSQTAALRAHAASSRLEVPEGWVFEDEGHSGATLVRPALEALRDLAAQGCVDVVLCYSPDRLARKFAYQALLIEEFARAGTRVEFVNGPRGDSPEDQLLIQFQGMFAEYEKAQLMERYRRGKAYRARSGSVNVLGGAPFGYRYIRKTPEAGARYEIIEHEAVLVAEMFRRYADDGATIADLARWLTSQGVPTRTGKHRWDRSVIWGMLRNPAYAGRAVFGKTQVIHEQPGLNRVARLQGRTTPRPVKTVDRPREEWTEIAVPAIVDEDTFARVQQRLADNKRFASRNSKVPVPAAGPGRLLGLRLRLLPRPTTTHRRQQDLLLPVPGLRRLPVRRRPGLRQQAGPRRLPRPVVWDHITGLLADPALIRAEIDRRLDPGPHLRPGHPPAQTARTRPGQGRHLDHRDDRGLLRAADHHRRAARPDAAPARPRGQPARPARRARRPGRRPRRLPQARRRPGRLPRPAARQRRHRHHRTTAGGYCGCWSRTSSSDPEKITIRHRIPVRERTASGGGHHDTTDTEGDMRQVINCVGGVIIPPCGVPVSVSSRSPRSVRTPDFRNAFTSAHIRLSLILARRRSINAV